MVIAKKKKRTPPPNLVAGIYNRFQAKAALITAKNFDTFESALKRIDYLEINHLLHQLSQIKGIR